MGKSADRVDDNELHQVFQALMTEAMNSSNYSFNITVEDVINILREKQNEDQNVSSTTEIVLIAVYSFLIIGGLVTNLLISFVIARRRQMHTARNLYIVNLTVSDISLCLICMPFGLVTIIRRQWTLGPLLCKLVHTLQGTNIMVSVGTITVIALDRYFTICKRTTEDVSSTRRRVVISIVLIWVISILACAPVFYSLKVEVVQFQEIVLYEKCMEEWHSGTLRIAYAAAVLLVMAVIPPLVVGIVHARIASYLHAHTCSQKDSARAKREIERNRRTSLLLTGILVIFVVSWLPLGLFSLLADVNFSAQVSYQQSSTTSFYTTLAIVHICAMSSAISNPIVYGWLNSNIRREFLSLLPQTCAEKCQQKSSRKLTTENDTMRTQINIHTHVDGSKENVALLVTVANKQDGAQPNSTHL